MGVSEHVGKITVDFDHHRAEHVVTALETYRRLRAEAPVAWSPHHGGFWIVSRYEDVMALTRDPEAYISTKTFDPDGTPHGGVTIPTSYLWMPPTETDKPDWLRYRTVLAPLFTPKGVSAYRETVEQFTHELIDRAIEKGKIDLLVDLVNPVPSLVTMHLLGLPLDEWQRFTMPMHEKNYAIPGSESAARARRGVEWFLRYVREQIAVQRKERRPGLISYLMDADVIGESRIGGGDRLNDREIFFLALQLLAGGVDTTTALTSNALEYLDQNHVARDRLTRDRSLMATACEEFMRFTSPVQGLGRTAARDIELGGQHIKAGERILFLFASANRDETEFSAPDEFQLDRFPNRHLGFGIGLHRCLGSTLARLMFSTMVGAVLDRMPDYKIDRSRTEHYPSIAAVNGWKALPASFTPGPKRLSKQIIPPWKEVIELGDKDAPGLSVAELLTA